MPDDFHDAGARVAADLRRGYFGRRFYRVTAERREQAAQQQRSAEFPDHGSAGILHRFFLGAGRHLSYCK